MIAEAATITVAVVVIVTGDSETRLRHLHP